MSRSTQTTIATAGLILSFTFGLFGTGTRVARAECTPEADGLGALVGQLPDAPGGSVLGTPCDSQAVTRSSVHDKSPIKRGGPWRISSDAAEDQYGTTPDAWGTTKVKAAEGLEFVVRDMQYPLPDGSVGTQVIPTKDFGDIDMPGGGTVPGYAIMDRFARKASGFDADGSDPIYLLAGFTHFEGSEGSYKELAGPMVKSEMGVTHLAAYIGEGETTNSPDDYHGSQWENDGYPATVFLVRTDMDGNGSVDADDQRTLNQNAHTALGILGHGVRFPGDYKNDPLTHARSLKRSLEFYKKWLENEDDPFFDIRKNKLYCAELQTLALNIALNVPHNERAFRELFGDDGPRLLQLAKDQYKRKRGEDLVETDFVPLYKRTPGFNVPAGTPVIDAPDAAIVGNGLAWMPQTTADIMTNFIETYASPMEVGGPISASVVMSFKDLIQQRTGVTTEEYMKLAVPVMQKIMIFDALTQPLAGDPTQLEAHIKKAAGTLYVALGGDVADLRGGTPDPRKMGLVEQVMAPLKASGAEVLRCAGATGLDRTKAHSWLRGSIHADIDVARGLQVSNSGAATYFSAPAVPVRIATGQWKSHPAVQIMALGTAVNADEVEYVGGESMIYPPGIAPDADPVPVPVTPPAPPADVTETEPNDEIRNVRGSRAGSNQLTAGEPAIGVIDSRSDADIFRVEIPRGGTLNIRMQPPRGQDYDVALLNSEGVSVRELENGGDDAEETTFTPTDSRTVFYIKVFGYDGASSDKPYTLTVDY